MKILIADKDSELLSMLTINLKAHGFKVIAARDAVQAWLSVLREVPDLVLMDTQLPGGSGYAVVRSMKRSSKTSHIPAFLMTNENQRLAEEQVKESGADRLLIKPINLVELVKLAEGLSVGEPVQRPDSTPAPAVPTDAVPITPTKILIAEDDPGTRHMLQSLLSKWDYQVISVSNGQQALQVLQAKGPPQIAVLDWEMPGTKGIDVVRAVRQMQHDVYIYIILLTAKSFKDDLIEGLQAGADDYMVKPFDAHELRLRVGSGRRIVQLQEELLEAKAPRKATQPILT